MVQNPKTGRPFCSFLVLFLGGAKSHRRRGALGGGRKDAAGDKFPNPRPRRRHAPDPLDARRACRGNFAP